MLSSLIYQKNTKNYLMKTKHHKEIYSQRQLRVGELVKQNLGEIFIRNEAKIPVFKFKISNSQQK